MSFFCGVGQMGHEEEAVKAGDQAQSSDDPEIGPCVEESQSKCRNDSSRHIGETIDRAEQSIHPAFLLCFPTALASHMYVPALTDP
jgi:hypothetical protein